MDPEPFVLSPRVATPLQLQLVTLTREVVSSGQSTASRYFLLSVLNPARQPHETSHVFLGSFLVGIIPEHILAALSTPLNREVCHRQQDLLAWFSGDVTRAVRIGGVCVWVAWTDNVSGPEESCFACRADVNQVRL